MNLQVSTEVQKECGAWRRTAQHFSSTTDLDRKPIVPDKSQMFGTPSQSKHRQKKKMSEDLTSAPLKNEPKPILTFSPPSLHVSIQHDKVKQTSQPVEVLLGLLLGANRPAVGERSEASGLESGVKRK